MSTASVVYSFSQLLNNYIMQLKVRLSVGFWARLASVVDWLSE